MAVSPSQSEASSSVCGLSESSADAEGSEVLGLVAVFTFNDVMTLDIGEWLPHT